MKGLTQKSIYDKIIPDIYRLAYGNGDHATDMEGMRIQDFLGNR